MTIQEKDKKFVWHPFTHLLGALSPVNIVKGEGVYLIDDSGKRYVDAISSWWVNLHGHCNPFISQKVSDQLFQLEHAIFSDFTHPAAVNLAEKLLQHLPENQKKIFYSDNGSTAVEVALKMALQYWNNLEQPKSTFIAFEQAYHGDTFGGMSVGARNVFNQAFEKLLFDVRHIPLPTAENINEVIAQMSEILAGGDVAGFIFEPLVQGAAGMKMYEAQFLDELLSLCKHHKIVTIADEVMTGFGRCGSFFASDFLKVKPDIVCMSKGITGGYLPLGATSSAQFIYDAFVTDDKRKTFFHGHSYTANPVSCSAALASIELLEREETKMQLKMIEELHAIFEKKLRGHHKLKSVRCKGTILALELKTMDRTHYLNEASQSITSFFMDKGIILRPLGNVFYLIPPYVITAEQLNSVYLAIEEFLNQ
jgi:adenosylmethionine---8-amino-7-oxononanoate aminotransferase